MLVRILAVCLLVGVIAAGLVVWRTPRKRVVASANPIVEERIQRPAADPAKKLTYRVVASYPHDPEAFLQGLVWHDGKLYESTGLEGKSTLREVDLKTGRVLRKLNLASRYFAEGLAVTDGKLVQLTWKSGEAFVYDAQFKQLETHRYDGEGWGLAFDGADLVMSCGSDVITFRDPKTFMIKRTLKATLNGAPIYNLNELEYIDGRIWANVWHSEYIVCIDPRTGVADSYLDLRGLLPNAIRTGREDVLNGIAHDAKTGRILIGGKLWPRLFEIKLTGQ